MKFPEVEVPQAEVPEVEVPQVEVPEVEVPEVETAPLAPEESSHIIRGTRAQFVSTQVGEEVLTPSDTQTEEPATQIEEPATQTTVEPATQTTAEPATQTGEQADQTDGPPAPPTDTDSVKLPQADLPQTGGIGSDLDEELKKQEAAPERKYKPLTDVAESIRRDLALPEANRKMSQAIETINHDIDDYFFELDAWENEGTNDESEKPTLPDFEALAKKYNLQLKQTGLVDREEMKTDPLGSIQLGGDTLSNALFFMASNKELYEATPFGGATPLVPDYYLFWNIENEKPHVADFAECKDQVAKFWKNQQALELAKKDAESISIKVNDARKSKLSELYPEKALPTGQFYWFDTRRGGILSKPGNVDKPSDEFMETAFSLAELEAGVAVNRDRDTVYVIQSISGNRPVEELGADYLKNKFMNTKRVPREVIGAAVYYSRQEQGKAGEALKEQLGFEYDSDYSN